MEKSNYTYTPSRLKLALNNKENLKKIEIITNAKIEKITNAKIEKITNAKITAWLSNGARKKVFKTKLKTERFTRNYKDYALTYQNCFSSIKCL